MKTKFPTIELTPNRTSIPLIAAYDEYNKVYNYKAFDTIFHWQEIDEDITNNIDIESYITKDLINRFSELAILKSDDKDVIFQNENYVWFEDGVFDLTDKSIEDRIMNTINNSNSYSFIHKEHEMHFKNLLSKNEIMKKINIYDVDRTYLLYLKNKEIEHRGFSTIPNFGYEDSGRERKFSIGPVLEIDGINYYVFASHKTILNDDVTPIYFEREPGTIKGTLRYQYMIPVPRSALIHRNINNETDPSRASFLFQYLNSIKHDAVSIMRNAEKVYHKQVSGQVPEYLKERFNDFKYLESKMLQYELNQKLGFQKEEEIVVDFDEKINEFTLVYENSYRRKIENNMISDINLMAHLVEEDLEYLEYIHEKGLELLQLYEDEIEM